MEQLFSYFCHRNGSFEEKFKCGMCNLPTVSVCIGSSYVTSGLFDHIENKHLEDIKNIIGGK